MRQLKIATQITNRDSQAVEKYLQEISKIPMITPEEETVLAQRIKMGDQKALDKLVQANLRFVVSVAKQYQHQGLSLSDLINEGNLGQVWLPAMGTKSVALALGCGTMIGWKRIVVTVGEKIGKTHLTYAQGASAEITAMITIWMADNLGLPVSTTHVLSSGIAGTMAANKSGLQMSTVRDIALAWVFTLPAAALLSGCLFWLFNMIAK